ncbi:MAG TPA: hypothetical protein VFT87_04930 [Candidatus Saccharimonadales bacterium]|nr:hypothetical protein [Candidatus Saccharimonadales bacterium]
MYIAAVAGVLFVLSLLAVFVGLAINALPGRSDLLQTISSANILVGNAGMYLAVHKLIGLDFSMLTLLLTINLMSLPWVYKSWPIMRPLVIRALRALRPGAHNPWQTSIPKVA